jgi:hypothetical protein
VKAAAKISANVPQIMTGPAFVRRSSSMKRGGKRERRGCGARLGSQSVPLGRRGRLEMRPPDAPCPQKRELRALNFDDEKSTGGTKRDNAGGGELDHF